jgi:putative PIN family toxin of toxin-antitoxin system
VERKCRPKSTPLAVRDGMRIVADTNTVVSGLLWQGAPRTLIDLGRAGRLSLSTSVTLIDELARVLNRAKFKARIDQAGLSARGLVEDYSAMADVVTPAALPRRISTDPDDDAVIACALAARADAIVSGDSDLLSVGAYAGIPMITATQCLARMKV